MTIAIEELATGSLNTGRVSSRNFHLGWRGVALLRTVPPLSINIKSCGFLGAALQSTFLNFNLIDIIVNIYR